MRTFKDLQWYDSALGKRGVIKFKNGYELFVYLGAHYYSNGVDTYAVACIKNGCSAFPKGTSFENDICKYQTKTQINKLIREIQKIRNDV